MSKHHIFHFAGETLEESHLSMNTFTFKEWFSSANLTRSLKTERSSLFNSCMPSEKRSKSNVETEEFVYFYLTMV